MAPTRTKRKLDKRQPNPDCQKSKNEYFQPTLERCLSCSNCPVGKEIDRTQHLGYEIHKGYLGCASCVLCPAGHFSTVRSFDPCKRCTNCQEKGQETIAACTAKTNTVCGPKLKPTTRQPEHTPGSTSVILQETKGPGQDANILFGVLAGVIFCIVVAVILYIIRRKRKHRRTKDVPSINVSQNVTQTPRQDDRKSELLIQTTDTPASDPTSNMGNNHSASNTGNNSLKVIQTPKRRRRMSFVLPECVKKPKVESLYYSSDDETTPLLKEEPMSKKPLQRMLSYPFAESEREEIHMSDSLESYLDTDAGFVTPPQALNTITSCDWPIGQTLRRSKSCPDCALEKHLQVDVPPVPIPSISNREVSDPLLITPELLMTVAKKIGPSYRYLGRMLGVSDDAMGVIAADNQNNTVEQAYKTLKKWTEVKGDLATIDKLFKALIDCDRKDIVDTTKENQLPRCKNQLSLF